MLRERSASTFDSPTRKKPSVTLTARPASGVPRACSVDFINRPGTFLTPPPAKSDGGLDRFGAPDHGADILLALGIGRVLVIQHDALRHRRDLVAGRWLADPV